MRPLPDESESRNLKPSRRGGRDEIRRLADRLIAYSDLDRENDADVTELIEATRRQLLKAHAIRAARAKSKKRNNRS